jgi:hypothetical protein
MVMIKKDPGGIMKIVATISLVAVIALVLAFSVFGDKNDETAAAKGEASDDQGTAISWVRFDDGLKQATVDNKYILAYFWRPG